MSELVRLSLSIEKALFEKLEHLSTGDGYENRSEFVRDMIRDYSVLSELKSDKEVIGTVTMIYDHHKRELSKNLTELQHHNHKIILASTHIHLDETICAEMIMFRGRPSEIRELANHLRKQKGVFQANLTFSTTGKSFIHH